MNIFNLSFINHSAAALLTIAVLSACGGGGGSGDNEPSPQYGSGVTAPGPAPSAPRDADTSTKNPESAAPDSPDSITPPKDEPATVSPVKPITTIEYHGDSTVWGYASGSGHRVATPAPTAFAAALPTPSRYVVRNKGVSSADACELLNGGNSRYAQSWETQMAASDADIVIINHGINDQWRMNSDRYASCLSSLAATAKKHGKKVIFETPNPTRDSYPGGLETYANAMKAVAAQHGAPVIDQYTHLMTRLNGNYRNVTTICPDGLHPSDDIYIAKGKFAASQFSKLGL